MNNRYGSKSQREAYRRAMNILCGPSDKECLRDKCSECKGSGKKSNGDICVHHLVCRCPKCLVK